MVRLSDREMYSITEFMLGAWLGSVGTNDSSFSGGAPVMVYSKPALWSFMSCVAERISVERCIHFAMRGRCSQKCTPGTDVGMEPNSPRNSIGALGLGSKVS